MKIVRKGILFVIGASGYYGLELAWRGWSHPTMFVLGGLCFLLIGRLNEVEPKLCLPGRLAVGAAICTFGELLFGLLFNRDYQVWDYRGLPLNWGGQICLFFTLLWIPVSALALWLYTRCNKLLDIAAHSDSFPDGTAR